MQQPLLRDMLPADRRPWADIQDSPFSSQEDSPPLALPFLSQGSCGPEASQHSETSSQRALRHRLDHAVRLGGSGGAPASQSGDGTNLEDSPIIDDSPPVETQAEDLLLEEGTSQLSANESSAIMQPAPTQMAASAAASNATMVATASSSTRAEAFPRTDLPPVCEESPLQEPASKPYDIHHLFRVATAKVPTACKAAATPQRRRSNAQKRQGCAGSATAQTPLGKRPRPSLPAAAAPPQPKDPEPAKEDVWERRQGKRENAIIGVKKSLEYKDFDARRARGELAGSDIPLTPDPTDDNVSKRKWEGNVMQWRKKLKTLYAENGGVQDLQDSLDEGDDAA
mmetsp:Transcript_155584/g.274786  ORF Transcript_155584/g.274786 Transcript_155584/m.274786 type:complete len:340 (+) Transcript_155584:87-1106(+)